MAMTITSFTPTSGAVGQAVTLNITDLPATASASNVFVYLSGDPDVQVTGVSPTDGSVDVTIQTNAQGGEFVVICGTENAESSGIFTVNGTSDQPVILSMMPGTGSADTTITLGGQNLNEITSIIVDMRIATITSHSTTQIRFSIPLTVPAGTHRVYAQSSTYGRVNCPYKLTVT